VIEIRSYVVKEVIVQLSVMTSELHEVFHYFNQLSENKSAVIVRVLNR